MAMNSKVKVFTGPTTKKDQMANVLLCSKIRKQRIKLSKSLTIRIWVHDILSYFISAIKISKTLSTRAEVI